jgi:hypothetical protein
MKTALLRWQADYIAPQQIYEAVEKAGRDKMKFKEIRINAQEGDVITSKKGLAFKSSLTDETFLVNKVEIRGEGFEAIGNKLKIKQEDKRK